MQLLRRIKRGLSAVELVVGVGVLGLLALATAFLFESSISLRQTANSQLALIRNADHFISTIESTINATKGDSAFSGAVVTHGGRALILWQKPASNAGLSPEDLKIIMNDPDSPQSAVILTPAKSESIPLDRSQLSAWESFISRAVRNPESRTEILTSNLRTFRNSGIQQGVLYFFIEDSTSHTFESDRVKTSLQRIRISVESELTTDGHSMPIFASGVVWW